jgi:hypothetical protein
MIDGFSVTDETDFTTKWVMSLSSPAEDEKWRKDPPEPRLGF